MVEERRANIIQVPKQSEETTAQFVIPDLHNTEAEERLYTSPPARLFLSFFKRFKISVQLQASHFHFKMGF